jgi:lipoprotein NlpD
VASKGIEIGGRLGEPILSAAPGRVVYTGTLPGYGNLIVIKHNAMYLTAYAHSQSVLVKEGEVVARGQQIATMGTGNNTGRALLHFEVRKYGKAVDPLLYLPPQ